MPPLAGRTAIVTGVSRRTGIGFAIAQRLAAMGANLVIHSWTPHDDGGAEPLLGELRGEGVTVEHVEAEPTMGPPPRLSRMPAADSATSTSWSRTTPAASRAG